MYNGSFKTKIFTGIQQNVVHFSVLPRRSPNFTLETIQKHQNFIFKIFIWFENESRNPQPKLGDQVDQFFYFVAEKYQKTNIKFQKVDKGIFLYRFSY